MKRGNSDAASLTAASASSTVCLTPERLEVGVVERLHPDRQPVDARGEVAAKPPRLDACRIGLERDLGVRLEPPFGGYGVDDACTVCGRISDGVPPPKNTELTARPGAPARRDGRRPRAFSGSRMT